MEKGRILVLDDDPVVTLSCKRILGAEGYSISTVEKGEDALNKLSKEDFDLLISDVRRSEERRVGKECRSRWSPYH